MQSVEFAFFEKYKNTKKCKCGICIFWKIQKYKKNAKCGICIIWKIQKYKNRKQLHVQDSFDDSSRFDEWWLLKLGAVAF